MQFDVVSSFFLIKWSKKEDKEKPKWKRVRVKYDFKKNIQGLTMGIQILAAWQHKKKLEDI